MYLANRLTPQQVLARFVDPVTYHPAEPLRHWLQTAGIDHNGELAGDEGTGAIVPASQLHFQRYHLDGTPKARTEIDLAAEDSAYGKDHKRQLFRALSRLGLFYHQFAMPIKPIDCLLLHASYFPELLMQFNLLVRY